MNLWELYIKLKLDVCLELYSKHSLIAINRNWPKVTEKKKGGENFIEIIGDNSQLKETLNSQSSKERGVRFVINVRGEDEPTSPAGCGRRRGWTSTNLRIFSWPLVKVHISGKTLGVSQGTCPSLTQDFRASWF